MQNIFEHKKKLLVLFVTLTKHRNGCLVWFFLINAEKTKNQRKKWHTKSQCGAKLYLFPSATTEWSKIEKCGFFNFRMVGDSVKKKAISLYWKKKLQLGGQNMWKWREKNIDIFPIKTNRRKRRTRTLGMRFCQLSVFQPEQSPCLPAKPIASKPLCRACGEAQFSPIS